jgi:hypothetical protein
MQFLLQVQSSLLLLPPQLLLHRQTVFQHLEQASSMKLRPSNCIPQWTGKCIIFSTPPMQLLPSCLALYLYSYWFYQCIRPTVTVMCTHVHTCATLFLWSWSVENLIKLDWDLHWKTHRIVITILWNITSAIYWSRQDALPWHPESQHTEREGKLPLSLHSRGRILCTISCYWFHPSILYM